jgi:hypothetical protein
MTFNEIEDKALRTYNRCVMFYNIMEDSGKEPAQEYISQFSRGDREDMVGLILRVKKEGLEKVKAEISRNLVLPKEEEAIG